MQKVTEAAGLLCFAAAVISAAALPNAQHPHPPTPLLLLPPHTYPLLSPQILRRLQQLCVRPESARTLAQHGVRLVPCAHAVHVQLVPGAALCGLTAAGRCVGCVDRAAVCGRG